MEFLQMYSSWSWWQIVDQKRQSRLALLVRSIQARCLQLSELD